MLLLIFRPMDLMALNQIAKLISVIIFYLNVMARCYSQ